MQLTYFLIYSLIIPIDTLHRKNTITETIISISQDVSTISLTEITNEVNRCYQPSGYEKYENGGE